MNIRVYLDLSGPEELPQAERMRLEENGKGCGMLRYVVGEFLRAWDDGNQRLMQHWEAQMREHLAAGESPSWYIHSAVVIEKYHPDDRVADDIGV